MSKTVKLTILGVAALSSVPACGASGQPEPGPLDHRPVDADAIVRRPPVPIGMKPSTPIPTLPGCEPPEISDPLRLYLAPEGDDAASGDLDSPLRSLAEAQARLPTPLDRDVEINVLAGVYRAQTVAWTKTSETHHVVIQAYGPGEPIFDGAPEGQTRSTLRVLLDLQVGDGSRTNLVVRGLTIRNYIQMAIRLGNEYETPDDLSSELSLGNCCNALVDNRFLNTGNAFGACCTSRDASGACVSDDPGGYLFMDIPACSAHAKYVCDCTGYAGVDVMNSSHNVFKNNDVIDSINGWRFGLIHAFYIAYPHSDFNLIEGNYIRGCTGDPIKFRDGASHNVARDNYLERAGRTSFFLEGDLRSEATSIANELEGNVATFPYGSSTIDVINNEAAFIVAPGQRSPDLVQGAKPTQERVTAVASGDIDGDGAPEVFVALSYPELGFTKLVYTGGRSPHELRKVAFTSTYFSVEHLAIADFGGEGTHLVANLYNSSSEHTKVVRGQLEDDGSYAISADSARVLLEVSGEPGWKITAMTAGKLDDQAFPSLFTAFQSPGGSEIHRGDGVTPGGLVPGVSGGAPLDSAADEWVTALAVGELGPDLAPSLVAAFQSSSSARSRIHYGNGGLGSGATNGGVLLEDDPRQVRALTFGAFTDQGPLLVAALATDGAGEVYSMSQGDGLGPLLHTSSLPVTGLAAADLISNGAAASDELVVAAGDELVSKVTLGDGTSSGTGGTSLGTLYSWP
jgi:hypothetical protein